MNSFEKWLKRNYPRVAESVSWCGDQDGRIAMAREAWKAGINSCEVERHQGEPVDALILDDCVEHRHPGYGSGYFGTEVVKLYTHADAGEVERLREKVKSLRAQLVERDALLRKAHSFVEAWDDESREWMELSSAISNVLLPGADPNAPID